MSPIEEPSVRYPIIRVSDYLRYELESRLRPDVQNAYRIFLPQTAEHIHAALRNSPIGYERLPLILDSVARAQTHAFDVLGNRGGQSFHEEFLPIGIRMFMGCPDFLLESTRLALSKIPSGGSKSLRTYFRNAGTLVDKFDYDLFEWAYQGSISEAAANMRLGSRDGHLRINEIIDLIKMGEGEDPPEIERENLGMALSPLEMHAVEEVEWGNYLMANLPRIFFKRLELEAPEEMQRFLELNRQLEEQLQVIRAVSDRIDLPLFFNERNNHLKESLINQIYGYVSTVSRVYSALQRRGIFLGLESHSRQFDTDIRRGNTTDIWEAMRAIETGDGIVTRGRITANVGEFDYFSRVFSLNNLSSLTSSVTIDITGRFLTAFDNGHPLTRRSSAFSFGVESSTAALLSDGNLEGLFKAHVNEHGMVTLLNEEGIRARTIILKTPFPVPVQNDVLIEVHQGQCTFYSAEQRTLLGTMSLQDLRKLAVSNSTTELGREQIARIYYPGEDFLFEVRESMIDSEFRLDTIKSRLSEAVSLLKDTYPQLPLQRLLSSTTTLEIESSSKSSYLGASNGRGRSCLNILPEYSTLMNARALIHEDQHNFYVPLMSEMIQEFISPKVRAQVKHSYKEKTAAEAVVEDIHETLSRLADFKFIIEARKRGVITADEARAAMEEQLTAEPGVFSNSIGMIQGDIEDLERLGEQNVLTNEGRVYVSGMRAAFEALKIEFNDGLHTINTEPISATSPPKLKHTIIDPETKQGGEMRLDDIAESFDPITHRYAPELLSPSERYFLPSGAIGMLPGDQRALPGSTTRALPSSNETLNTGNTGSDTSSELITPETALQHVQSLLSPETRDGFLREMVDRTPDRKTFDNLFLFFKNYCGEAFAQQHIGMIKNLALCVSKGTGSTTEILENAGISETIITKFHDLWGTDRDALDYDDDEPDEEAYADHITETYQGETDDLEPNYFNDDPEDGPDLYGDILSRWD